MKTTKKPASPTTDGRADAPTRVKDAPQRRFDLELTARSLRGDPGAKAAFARSMLCIPRFLGKLDELRHRRLSDDQRRDLAQEIMMRVWRDRAAFTGRSKLDTWMYSYVRNAYRESVRNVGSYATRREDLGDDTSVMSVEDRTIDEVGLRLDGDLVREEAAKLPEEQRVVLEMKLGLDLSFSEIARDLGSNTSTVKTRYYRALSEVRKRVTGGPAHRPD